MHLGGRLVGEEGELKMKSKILAEIAVMFAFALVPLVNAAGGTNASFAQWNGKLKGGII